MNPKNAPQFEGDPIAEMLNEKGYSHTWRVAKAAVISGAIPVVGPGLLLALNPDLLGRYGPALLLAASWGLSWAYASHFADSAHDVDFRRRYQAWVDKKKS